MTVHSYNPSTLEVEELENINSGISLGYTGQLVFDHDTISKNASNGAGKMAQKLKSSGGFCISS